MWTQMFQIIPDTGQFGSNKYYYRRATSFLFEKIFFEIW